MTTYHHVHIPKVAGISLAKDIRRHLPQSHRLNTREGCYIDMAKLMQAGDRMVVALREPTSQVYSQYLECADDIWGKYVTKHYRQSFSSLSTWLHHFTTAKEEIGKAFDFNCYHPLNMQTRALTCASRSAHHFQPSNITLALEIIRQPSTLLAITEFYHESMCLILENATGSLPSFCNCKEQEAWRAFHPSHDVHRVRRHSLRDLSPADHAEIESLTQEDSRLYAAAVHEFRRRVLNMERKYKVKVLCRSI